MSANFPPWLRPETLEANAFWTAGVASTLADFFAAYSLHDSEWLGFSVDPRYDGDGVAAFRLDTFWFREQAPEVNEVRWAALLVKFRRVGALRLSGFEEDEAMPRTIASAETQGTSDNAVLTVEDIMGGRVEITHSPEVVLLCLDWEGNVLPIPGVAAS